MIVVQELISHWGKDLRSAGELRRDIPTALPVVWNGDGKSHGDLTVLHQVIEFTGEDGFASSPKKLQIAEGSGSEIFRSGALLVRLREGSPVSLAIKLVWSTEVGAPHRPSRHLLNLGKGQWAQFTYNGRTGFSGTVATEWRYMQRTVNIGFVETIEKNLFLASAPIRQFQDLAVLR